MKIQWKKLLVVSLAVALLGVNIKSLAEEAAESRRLSILTISGEEAFVARSAGNEMKAVAGMPIAQGNKVRTGAKTNLYVQADNSKIIKLENNTEAEVTQASSKKLKITLKSGEMFFNVDKPLEEGEELNFDAAQTSMSIRGTSGIIRFEEDKLTFYLIEGHVEWNIGDQELTIQTGQKVILKRDFNDQLPTAETRDFYLFELIESFDWKDLNATELETVLQQQNWVDLSAIGLGTQEALEEASAALGKNVELFSLTSSQKIIKTSKVTGRKSRSRSSSRTEGTPEETTKKEPTSLASPSDASPSTEETTKAEPSTSETETTPENTQPEETTKPTSSTEKPTESSSSEEKPTKPSSSTEESTEPSSSEEKPTKPSSSTEESSDSSSSTQESTKPTSSEEKPPETEPTKPVQETLYWVYYEDESSSVVIDKELIKDGEEPKDETPETFTIDGEQIHGYRRIAPRYWINYTDDISNTAAPETITGELPINENPDVYIINGKKVLGYLRPLYWVYYEDESSSVVIDKELIKEGEEPLNESPETFTINDKNVRGYRRIVPRYWINYTDDISSTAAPETITGEEPKNEKPEIYIVNGKQVLGYLRPLYIAYYNNDKDTKAAEVRKLDEVKESIGESETPSFQKIGENTVWGYSRPAYYWIDCDYDNSNNTIFKGKELITDSEQRKEEPIEYDLEGRTIQGYYRYLNNNVLISTP